MLGKSPRISERDKAILCLIVLLKKNSSLNSHVKESKAEEDALYAQKITEHRHKLIYTMCQPTKVMDYLESADVIPRSLRPCIHYVRKNFSNSVSHICYLDISSAGRSKSCID